MRHGAVAAYAGLVWVTTSSSSHGPRAARGCDQFLRSEWAIRHFYPCTVESTFRDSDTAPTLQPDTARHPTPVSTDTAPTLPRHCPTLPDTLDTSTHQGSKPTSILKSIYKGLKAAYGCVLYNAVVRPGAVLQYAQSDLPSFGTLKTYFPTLPRANAPPVKRGPQSKSKS